MADVIFAATEDDLAGAFAAAVCADCEADECKVLIDHDPKPYWALPVEKREELMEAATRAMNASTVPESSEGVLSEVAWNHKDIAGGGEDAPSS